MQLLASRSGCDRPADLPDADAEQSHRKQLLVKSELQLVEIRHWQNDDSSVGDEVDNAHGKVVVRLAAAATFDCKVPVSLDGSTDEQASEDVADIPHDDQNAEAPGPFDQGRSRYECRVHQQNRHLTEANNDVPEKRERHDPLQE